MDERDTGWEQWVVILPDVKVTRIQGWRWKFRCYAWLVKVRLGLTKSHGPKPIL